MEVVNTAFAPAQKAILSNRLKKERKEGVEEIGCVLHTGQADQRRLAIEI
jgi:hypothetical protein